MAKRKPKTKEEVLVRSALRVTLTLDFPVSEAGELANIRKMLNETEVYKLITEEFYTNEKIKSKLVVLEESAAAPEYPDAV